MASTGANRAAARRDRGGFTLIELIVVLAVIGLVLALVLPNVGRGLAPYRLAATARELATALRLARNQAVAENRPTQFVVTSGAYGLNDTGHLQNVPQGVALTFLDSERTGPAPTTGTIRFYPDGSSTGGALALSAGKIRYTVLVEWLDSDVSIQSQSTQPRQQ